MSVIPWTTCERIVADINECDRDWLALFVEVCKTLAREIEHRYR